MTIMCQVIMVDSETKRPFSTTTFATSHTPQSAKERQAHRARIGGKFRNGWYMICRQGWTEYQRYFSTNKEYEER